MPLREVLSTGVPIINLELILERSDQSRINVLANITALRDSAGAVAGAVSIFQDITELKRIQQDREALLHELERSNRELLQFSYSVSHDLRAPVRRMRVLTNQLVRRDGSLTEGSAHLLTLIDQATSGMERLIESLLWYAQAGHGQLNRQPVAVEQVIESVRRTLAPLITETGAHIIVCKPLPAVDADPVLLEQLLQNLLANALLYRQSDEAPVVEISGGQSRGMWQFAVKDNGQGIPPNYHDRIFEPLKRLHGSDTPGTGLGLALCRTIVARHGGRIWVQSDGPDCGAIFRFTLPAGEESSPISKRWKAAQTA